MVSGKRNLILALGLWKTIIDFSTQEDIEIPTDIVHINDSL